MKDSESTGRLVLFFMNLLWEIGWGLAGAAALLLRKWFGVPLWCGLALLALWALMALVKTAVLCWSIAMGARREAPKVNKNPYTIWLDFPLPTVERDAGGVDEEG